MRLKLYKIILLAAAAVMTLSAFTGCSTVKENETQASDSTFRIMTSFFPMYVAAVNIAGNIGGVTVSNMAEQQTGCLHDYTLTVKDMKKLSDADVFVINGAGMESFMDKAVKQNPDMKILNSSEGIEFIKDENTGEDNPHIWVSISGAIEQAKNIGKKLAEIDSAHAKQYEENTRTYVEKLEALKSKMHEKLDGLKNRKIVTFHEAFPYFAKEFNLEIIAVVEREPGTEPSAGELAKTIETIKATGVKVLFAEPQYSQESAKMIARETGAKMYMLDPVVTTEGGSSADAYLSAMESNLKTLEEALSANE